MVPGSEMVTVSIGEIAERIVRRLRMVDGESRATTPRVEEDANKGRPRAHSR